ncbi:hypothetical protein [Legionella sp. CNM-4043-24]|uniref:hypothetical protein n=1 Tax=Legionella sp. CNM-4043-24 TaxID=3421646 RepID=UPI00403B19F1
MPSQLFQQTLFQSGCSLATIEQVNDYYQQMMSVLDQFIDADPQAPDFYSLVLILMQRIDILRSYVEDLLHPVHDNVTREILVEQLMTPCFSSLSSLAGQAKLITGILSDQSWLADVVSRTGEHPIGFLKIPLISFGGYNIPLKERADLSSNKTFIPRPNLELRLHLYPDTHGRVLSEHLHAHGFDLFSRVGMQGILCDQRFDLYENLSNKTDKRRMDKLGVDLPEFSSESSSFQKKIDQLGVDSNTSMTKCFYAHETYRFESSKKSGYKPVLFTPVGKTFVVKPHKAAVSTAGSMRYHASQYPHFAMIYGSNLHTFCLTWRRQSVFHEQHFKPSFLLVDKALSSKSTLTNIKLLGEEKLKTILQEFSRKLITEIDVFNQLENQPEARSKYTLINLLESLLTLNKIKEGEVSIDTLRDIFYPIKRPVFSIENFSAKDSSVDPLLCVSLLCNELQQQIRVYFGVVYRQFFSHENEHHLELLANLLPHSLCATASSSIP